MRTLNRRTTTRLGTVPALLAALTLAAVAAGPALAKEGFQARPRRPDRAGHARGHDAARRRVGLVPGRAPSRIRSRARRSTSSSSGATGRRSGRWAARTRAATTWSGSTSRRPASPSVEVGVRGTSDLPILLQGTALVPGGIGALTAQVGAAAARRPRRRSHVHPSRRRPSFRLRSPRPPSLPPLPLAAPAATTSMPTAVLLVAAGIARRAPRGRRPDARWPAGARG